MNVMAVDYEVEFADDLYRMDLAKAHDERLAPMTDHLLDEFAAADVKATFFVLGFVAERWPHLVRRIHAAGHEIGCHSYLHEQPLKITRERQAEDLARAVRTIEDVTGDKVLSYRAPNFSLKLENLYTLDLLAAEGIRYDSSIFPIWRNDGGIVGFPRSPSRIALGAGEIYEFPLTVTPLLGREVQLFGGGYFRLAPLPLVQHKLGQLDRRNIPVQFYIHPYDLDADAGPYPFPLPRMLRFRMNVRRGSAAARFRQVCRRFRFSTLRNVMDGLIAASPAARAPAATYRDGAYRVFPLTEGSQ